jgi:multiple sugar transport system substrate-binding protein
MLRLLIAALLVLSGCSRRNSQPLKALVVEGPVADAFAAAVAEAKLSIEVTELSYSELALSARNAAPTPPKKLDKPSYDIIMLDDIWLPELASGVEQLKPPPETDFVEQFLELGRYKKHLLALPFVANAQVFFRDERYVPDPPGAWNDAIRQAAAIEHDHGIHGFALRGAFGNSLIADFLPLLWAYGGEIDPARGLFTSGPAADALRLMRRMAAYAAPGFLGFGTPEVRSQLRAGQAAMGIGWLSSAGALKARFKFSELPSLDAGGPKGQPVFSTWLLAIPLASARQGEAKKFLNKLLTKSVLKKASMESIPVVTSLMGKVGYRLPKRSRSRPRSERSTDIETKFSFAVSQVNVGALTPEDALRKLQQEIQAMSESKPSK